MIPGTQLKINLKITKKLTVKHLNSKLDISSLESYIENNIIPRSLREKVIPAKNLHNPRFLGEWKKQCINHGIEIMWLIIEEEKLQLLELADQIDESSKALDPFKDNLVY